VPPTELLEELEEELLDELEPSLDELEEELEDEELLELESPQAPMVDQVPSLPGTEFVYQLA